MTPWTVACQSPLSMGFSRKEYWSGLPFPSPGDLPDLGIKPRSPALQSDSLLTEHQAAEYWWRISPNRVGWSHFIDTCLMGTGLCQTAYHTFLVQTLCLMYAFNTCLYLYLLPHFYRPLTENNGSHIGCNMKQQTGLKLGKEYVKAVYRHPAYLTSMHGTSWETLG